MKRFESASIAVVVIAMLVACAPAPQVAPAPQAASQMPTQQAIKPPTRVAPMLRDPTFAEMIAFLNKNKVNWNAYTSEYVCVDFACELQRDAGSENMRMAVVLIDFPGRIGHALVAFETTDQGLIYFEPQADHRMKVEIGRKYWSWIYWPEYNYDAGYDDTVISIELIWDVSNSHCR